MTAPAMPTPKTQSQDHAACEVATARRPGTRKLSKGQYRRSGGPGAGTACRGSERTPLLLAEVYTLCRKKGDGRMVPVHGPPGGLLRSQIELAIKRTRTPRELKAVQHLECWKSLASTTKLMSER